MKNCMILLALCALAACNTPGKPLPMVDKGDPTWALPPDHMAYGAMPK